MWQKLFIKWCGQEKMVPGNLAVSLHDYALVPLAMSRLMTQRSGTLLVVVPDTAHLEALGSALEAYSRIIGDERKIITVPEVSIDRRQWLPEMEASRCAALSAAINGQEGVYLVTARVLLSQTLSPVSFRHQSFSLKAGQSIAPEELARQLVELDYDNEYEVQAPGEFARRGGIFDIYSPLYDAPVRLDFWGNEIESLKFFLPETQRSFRDIKEVRIVPRGTSILAGDNEDSALVRDFFPSTVPMVLCSPRLIEQQLADFSTAEVQQLWTETVHGASEVISLLTEPDEAFVAEPEAKPRKTGRGRKKTAEPELPPKPEGLPVIGCSAQTLAGESLQSEYSLLNTQLLRDNLCRWTESHYTIVACCAGDGEAERFQQVLKEHPSTANLTVTIEKIRLDVGLLFPDVKLVMLSSQELFGHTVRVHRHKHIDYHFNKNSQNDYLDLEAGMLAVHAAHGICRYNGIIRKQLGEEVMEAMELEFADEAKLYVPLEQAQLVSRYMGGSKTLPSLSPLNGTSWNRRKEQAAGAAWDLAAELLRLEALRQSSEGMRLQPVLEWENSFAASFPYTETSDQARAIQDVLHDMESAKPMDRLLCGDVGYGKTEVAMRAAFRAVMNGHQVAVLVPTTVLAQQHYQSFRERMSQYPVNIDMISRFRSKKEQKEILERLETGEIDLIIGTHALLSSSVHFASLGLLIIDEEQRFGVKHKQRLKEMRSSIDILTMTATPIPRTLYFSLSGLRNLSTIMTAPADRLPVSTIVAYFDKELIRQAIMRELERKGQVFFLYNRVNNIDEFKDMLARLVPEARFVVAHGQMTATQLENVMTEFVQRKFDVLVCTTIIESGIDMPNVNTIIIEHADRFGLSELYQLRGRVGRYHRQAYAYLLLPPSGVLQENARQRLAAIRRYTHLGAGMKLAMKDLEIRGAGNILGEEQSGHIAAVGFELYCQLLKEAVARLEHRELPKVIQVPVDFDLVTNSIKAVPGRAQACLPPEYISEEPVRLECYKEISQLAKIPDVDNYAAGLEDRFGALPPSVKMLLDLAKIRILAQKLKLLRVNVRNARLVIETQNGLYKRNGQLPMLTAGRASAQIQETITVLQNMLPEKSR